jgi:polyketide synthase PksN
MPIEVVGLSSSSSDAQQTDSSDPPDAGGRRIARELLDGFYVPVWSSAPLQFAESSGSLAKVLVVGCEADTAALVRQISDSPLFASTQFEQTSTMATGFEHVLLIAPPPDSVDLETGLAQGAQALFDFIKGTMRAAKSARLVHLVPTRDHGHRPEYQALSGFYKTLRMEKPGYVGRVVQLEPAEAQGETLARIVRGEFQDSGKATDIRYVNGTRRVRKFHRPQFRPGIPAFRQGGVYLITGGLGAIGRIVARHLSEKYQATIYLTGRSALTDCGSSDLSAIAALGGQVRYFVCDVANRDDVHRAIASIHAAGHRLNGVLHSAGVIEDNFILKKTRESFARVIAPKTLGARNLDEATRDEPLDCFVLFSSVTAVLGNPGQCDYGFGNAFEDYFAYARQALTSRELRSGQTLSINWPLWKEGGMKLTEKQETLVRRNFGIVPLQSAAGIDALEQGLSQQLTQLIVMPGEPTKVSEVLGVVAAPAAAAPSTVSVAPRSKSLSNHQAASGSQDLIAIVGLSGRYPQAETLEEFWNNLKMGRDCVVEIPADRWDSASHFQPGRPVLGKTYGKWGGFLNGVDQFDPLFFSISPKEAEHMDPHERLFLETVALTIEDAGYTPEKITAPDAMKDNPVGVYVGLMWGDYQLHGVDDGLGTQATPHSFYWAVANRVSNFFNFSGPSITVDTACSSSLTAIHLACVAIQRGEIGAAIAGGVNLALHAHKYNVVSDMHMLSTDGRCRSFGAGGDGYVPGEGVGAVLLKPLSQARVDGDHIYAVIRGSALNHGGKTSGFTVPNPKRQAALVQEAFQNADVNPRYISYVEAHGTGTSLGDPIEITGLSKAFAQPEGQYCPIGSVKSNIGHLEAAAGIAGLTKVLLQMKHRTLVPSIHSSTLNRYIDWQRSPFYVQHALEEWRRPTIDNVEIARVAGISSFGAGGSNAHLIVEEYVEEPATGASGRPALIVLSAKKESSLKTTATKLADFLEAHPGVSLDDVAYTLQIGRVAMDLRLAIVADRLSDVVDCLRAYVKGSASGAGLFSGARGDWKASDDSATQAWIAEHDLLRIAAAWVRGFVVEWERLHDGGARKRLSLPGYSFHRERYWISKSAVTKRGPSAVAALHPLLDVNVSTLEQQMFSKTFRPEEFFLRDHRLGDNRIVPAVAYLEMAVQASRLAHARQPVAALRDVSWVKPIVVNEDSTTIYVGLMPDHDGVRFEMYSQSGEQRLLYSQGLVEFKVANDPACAEGPASSFERSVDLNAIISRSRSVNAEAVATTFAQMGFVFGPTFQVFEALYFNADEALAKLRTPDRNDVDASAYVLHPSLLDGAVRTVLGIDGFAGSARGVQVPVSLRSIEILQPVNGDCFAYAKRSSRASTHADQRCYDILLVDSAGKTLVCCEGLVIQTAPQLALRRQPATQASVSAPLQVATKTANGPAVLREESPPDPDTPVAGNITKQALQTAVTAYLVDLISKVTKLSADQIDPKCPLEKYGIDSVMILSLNESLERTFGEIPKTLFFEYLEIQSLAEYFAENYADRLHSVIAPAASNSATVGAAVADSTAESPARPISGAAGLGAANPLKGDDDGRVPTSIATGSVDDLLERVQEILFTSLKATLGSEAKDCSRETPLADWPLDPINDCRLLFRLQSEVEGLSRCALYRFESLREWAASLSCKRPAPHSTHTVVTEQPRRNRFLGASRSAAPLDIAIIGLSGRYPGADSIDAFWKNLSEGKDCVTEIPRSRWDFRRHCHSDRGAKRRVDGRWGGFIENVDQFDARFFNISAREAEILDPQERLFLQTAWECLEDACYTRSALKNLAVGVFVGVMWAHYGLIDVADEQLQYGRPSAVFSAIANRVSYFLNLSGPSIALDTMCSSSLTAIHTACQSIRSGDCELALAGGVNLIVHPLKYQFLSQGQFLATDGRCRAFGEGGDGYVPGEGVGAVLLKPLERALEDGDHIYAVIKGSTLNHGGKTNGFTVPNQTAQTSLISAALQRAGWDPSTIDYIEAHGTGTSLGDPIEIAGLSKAFAQNSATGVPPQCRIGSVKSNIGHLESAAGIAGLTKVLLQLKHRRIVPSLHCAKLNPNIDFAKSPFRVVQHLEDWELPGKSSSARKLRRAGISSFGAGGSNAHILIEDHARPAEDVSAILQNPVIFVLSADSESRLGLYVDRLLGFLTVPVDLRRLAFSSQVGREAMDERLAVVVSSAAELVEALTQFRKGAIAGNVHRGRARKHNEKLDSILNDEQKQSLIDSMLRGSRLEQLAKAWVSFLDLDWSRYTKQLFGTVPRRISFPVMPFITQRYWVQEKSAELATTAEAGLHPLLDKNISTLSQQRYFKQFSGEEFYLRDHIVATDVERVILPGVAYLEMIRVAGELALGEEWSVSHIRNLIWIQPLEVRQAPEQALVSLSQLDGAIEVEIARASTQDVYVQGELLYRPKGEPDADEWLDLAALRAEGVPEEDQAAIYESFRRMGFWYGSSYQVTHSRYRGPKGTLSCLRLPEHLRAGFSAFALHPSLLDAAARSCLAIGAESSRKLTSPLVPFALGDLEIRHPLTEECYAYATLAEGLGIEEHAAAIAGTALQKYNIVITDPSGRVLAKLSDLSARPLVKTDSTPSRRLQYFRYEWLETPVGAPVRFSGAHQTVLVIAKDSRLALYLAEHWGPEVKVVLAQAGESYKEVDALSFQFDAGSERSYLELIASLRDRALLPDRIVYCLDQAVAPSVYSIRSLFLALEAVSPGRAVRCAVLFEGNLESAQPHDQAVSAFAKALLTINHRFELFTVQWDAADPNRIALAVGNELEAEGNPTGHEIAYRAGNRHRRRLIAHEPRKHAASGESLPLPLKHRGVYLISGGVGKLGLVFAHYLASRCGARLILTGRSKQLSESQQSAIGELQKAGAEAHYYAADIANADEAAALIQFAKARCGEINGIIHCAGVGSRTPITELDRAGFASLLAPKIDGLINLDCLTEHEPLAFFAAFSSVSAVLGDPGGAGAYAVGNRFMDSYALRREALRVQGRRSGRSVSINWPLWATGGMGLPDEDASLFQFSGMSALTEEEGVAAFETILRGELTQVLVAAGDVEKITRTLQVHDATDTTPRASEVSRPAATNVRTPADFEPPVAVRPMEPQDTLQHLAEQFVKERLAVVVKAVVSNIDSHSTFEQCGMDSVMMMELRDSLSKELGALPKTVLFEHDTPARLARYLLVNCEDALRGRVGDSSRAASANVTHASPEILGPQQVAAASRPQPLPQLAVRASLNKSAVQASSVPASREEGVAIIGIAGQFPQAANLSEFWSNVQSARDCLTDIPPGRWDARNGDMGCRRGGFLPDIDQFDPALFRMTLAEAQKTDPQLRVLLRTAWQALEDSAYTPDAIESQRVGVYVGAMNEDFTWIMSDVYSRTGEYIGPGSVISDLANRISFLMNFRGPSLTVGTACSSSLTAVHLARRAILDNECDMALAGAVNLSLHPSKYLMLRDMKVLSSDGQERTFDEAANGLVPSEGVGVIVLKRLSQAFKDGDQIYGVIRSSCLSHSGTGAGQFLPNIRVIEETAARSIRESGIPADELTYIESHGSGTELGDPIELKALANAIRQFTSTTQFCAIGTRANLGHMEAASGISALIKVLLGMKHRELSPCAKLESVNTSFEHETSPFFFPRNAQPWRASPGRPLIAGINSFGMGGSNAFLIVESFVQAHAPPRPPIIEPSIVVLSARSDERLRAYLSATIEFLERADQQSMGAEDFVNFAYSSQVGRLPFKHRLAIVAADKRDFIEKARAYLTAAAEAPGVFVGSKRSTDALAGLMTGDEARDFITALIKSRQWNKIASIWACGGAIDWASMHAGAMRRRVSFPCYPFESIRCDIRAATAAGVAGAERGREKATVADGAPEHGERRDVKIEWFHLTPGFLGDAILSADFDHIEAGAEWAKQYWLDHLGETADTNRTLTPLLALEQPELTPADSAIQFVSDVLSGALIESLQRCTQTYQIEVETLIVAAWATLVNRYTKARCSQFGVLRALTPFQHLKTALLPGAEGSETQADFAEHLRNLVPVRICTVVRERISQWLEELQRNLNRKHVYGHIPLQQIENWVGVANLFDSVIVFEKTGLPWSSAARAVNQASQQRLASEIFASQTRVIMELTVTIHSDAIELGVLYHSGGPAREKVQTLLEHFKVLLEGLATNPHRNPAALQMRTRTESRETFWKTLERVNR